MNAKDALQITVSVSEPRCTKLGAAMAAIALQALKGRTRVVMPSPRDDDFASQLEELSYGWQFVPEDQYDDDRYEISWA